MAGASSRPVVVLLLVGLAASWFKGAEAAVDNGVNLAFPNLPSLPSSLKDFVTSMSDAGFGQGEVLNVLSSLGNGDFLKSAGLDTAGQLVAAVGDVRKAGPLTATTSVLTAPDNLRKLGDSLGRALGVGNELGALVQDTAVAARSGSNSLVATLNDQFTKLESLVGDAVKANNDILFELANLGSDAALAAATAPLKQAGVALEKLRSATPAPGALVGAVRDVWQPLTDRNGLPSLIEDTLNVGGLLLTSPLAAAQAAGKLASDAGKTLGAGFQQLLPYIPDNARVRGPAGDALAKVVGPLSAYTMGLGQVAGDWLKGLASPTRQAGLGRTLLDATAKTMVGLWTTNGGARPTASGPLASLLALRDAVDPSAADTTVTASGGP